MDPISGVGMPGMLVAQLATPTAAPTADDATRFADLVQAAPPPLDSPGITDPLVATARTPGESILNGMSTIGTDFKDAWTQAQQMLARPAGEMTTVDMLRMQMQMVQLSVQVEMVGKTISKATQNIDQLVKLQ